MKLPVFDWAGATTADPGSVSSWNHTLPVCKAGNILLLYAGCRGSGVSINTPTGFTAVQSDANAGYFYKVATDADSGATLSISLSTGPQYAVSACVVAQGVQGTPRSSTPVVLGTTVSPDGGSLTHADPTLDLYTWLSYYTVSPGNVNLTAAPSGYTIRLTLYGSGGSSGVALMLCTKDTRTYSATEDSGAGTLAATVTQWRAYTHGFAGKADPEIFYPPM